MLTAIESATQTRDLFSHCLTLLTANSRTCCCSGSYYHSDV